MKNAILLIIKAIRLLASYSLPFWKASEIDKILDKAEIALKEDDKGEEQ